MPYSKEHKMLTKKRILQSASELFSRNGFNNVSITEIMRLAKMTHGAFYAHFKSKEELFCESIAYLLQKRGFVRLGKGPASIKQLTCMVADYLNLKVLKEQFEPGPAVILVNEINNDRREIRQLYEEAYFRMKNLLTKRIIALSRLKMLPFEADETVAEEKGQAILAILVGAMALAKNIPSKDEQKKILRSAQKNILNTLGLAEKEFVLA